MAIRIRKTANIGSYDDEPATVQMMHEYMEAQGYGLDITDQRLHHEIYLSDAIKVANIVVGYMRQKEFISVHSIINKVTGGLLFIFPLTLAFIDLRCSAAVVCMVATIAAIQEGHLIKRKVIN